jgi:hypothetical protein
LNDAEDLAKLLLHGVPVLPNGLRLVLEISDEAADSIRVFSSPAPDAAPILGRDGSTLTIRHEISTPVDSRVFGIEGTRFADAGYDGTAVVTLKIERADGTVLASDAVKVRVAPFILSDSTRPLEKVYVSNADTNFVAKLKTAVGASRVVEVSAESYGSGNATSWKPDVWVQDEVEIGYTRTPSGVAVPVALDLPRNRGLEDWPPNELRGTNFGYSAKGGSGGSANYGGNLECTPPFTKDGVAHPYGRALVGTDMEPALVDFINAQGVQAPAIALDMGWLRVGHVDEVFAFVPSGSGFKVLVADTRCALDLLEGLNVDYSGDASGAGASALVDANCNWAVDQWAGGIVRIVSGDGSNQVRQVSGNTSDTLAVARPWAVPPGTNSQYQVVARSAYRCLFVEGNEDVGVASSCTSNSLTDLSRNWTPDCWAGGAIAIVSGDWHYHYAIAGNSSDTIYLEDVWDAAFPPDETSVYVVVTKPKLGDSDPSFPLGRPVSQTVRQYLELYQGSGVNIIYNENCQANIDAAVATLSGEIGLDDDDFVRIPSLFEPNEYDNTPVSYVPSMVNMLVDGNKLIVADPFGPRENGVDVFKADVIGKLPGFTLCFIDNWNEYHKNNGGVHCGTNARRVPRSPAD